MDDNRDVGELLGRFSERVYRSASSSRDAIADGYFRKLEQGREQFEKEVRRYEAPRHSTLPPFRRVSIRERLLGSRDWGSAHTRKAPVVVIIDQPSAARYGSRTLVWTSARVLVLAVAVFLAGFACGAVLSQLLRPELTARLPRIGVLGSRPPAVSSEGPAAAVEVTGEPGSAAVSGGRLNRADTGGEQPAAQTKMPGGTDDTRPALTLPVGSTRTPERWATPAGWLPFLCQGGPALGLEAWEACCPTGSPSPAQARAGPSGSTRAAPDPSSPAPGVPVDTGASGTTTESRKGYRP